MIQIDNKEDCCGCFACVQICPKHCVQVEEDEEGFFYPFVLQNQCIECGKCEKVCPVMEQKSEKKKTEPESGRNLNKAYVAYAKEEDLREKSSSGGLFSLFARQTLQKGGIVFGAAYDEKFQVHHIGVEQEDELWKLMGSKYVQSRMEHTYQKIQQELQKGREVLFCGTACQNAGLRSYLSRPYDTLFTIDILCHGVPSPKVWEKYKKEQEQSFGASVTAVSFRDKTDGWKQYSVKLQFANGKSCRIPAKKDRYMRLFLAEICLRPSCYACRFKGDARPSDLTIGDCWGVQGHSPEMDDDKGTSVVWVHSKKGEERLESLKGEICQKPMELDAILSRDADSRKPVRPHPKRAVFFRQIDQKSTAQLEKLLEPSPVQNVKQKLYSIIRKCRKKKE